MSPKGCISLRKLTVLQFKTQVVFLRSGQVNKCLAKMHEIGLQACLAFCKPVDILSDFTVLLTAYFAVF
jgi:hypothetical protein